MSDIGIASLTTFGELLKFLRKRAQLTQRELAIAVGYTEGHVSRLEKNQRLPDPATVAALFIPALGLEEEPETIAHLMYLAHGSHTDQPPAVKDLKVSRIDETTQIRENIESIPSNLPIQLTTFIGRQREIAEITGMLTRDNPARLVTLTGPGGIGKTRLALETVIRIAHLYHDGVWFVDLTPLSAPELVPQTVASKLEIAETNNHPIEETLPAYLRSKSMLIILDNCEHLIKSTAQLAEQIVRSCAHVSILATSREPLNISGEMNFRVPPLSLSEETDTSSQHIMGLESVQLFIERANQMDPTFAATDENASLLVNICKHLDGIPLAIELAAARINILSLSQIAGRLHDRFRLLSGGHTTLARHQTLRATLEWSHDLLSESEKHLFHRLSIFAGGWTLDAANTVCIEEGDDILDLLAQLVNKSLVTVERLPNTEVRYTMLETIREYAYQEWSISGDLERMRSRHFDYYFELATQAEPKLFATESSLDWAEAEMDNLRAALTWALEKDGSGAVSAERTGRALELMLHIWLLWLSRGYSMEGSEWLKRLLEVHIASTPARARALLLAADLAGFRGDYSGKMAFVQEALVIAQKLGDKKRIAWSLMQMGLVERDIRHDPEAIEFLTEGMESFEELKDDLWICRTCFLLAETHIANGNVEAASPLLQHGMEICRANNDKWQIAWGLELLGDIKRLDQLFMQAGKLYAESLELRAEIADKAGIIYALEAFARLATDQGYFERAAMVWGSTEKLRQDLKLFVDPLREDLRRSPIAAARARLGEEAFAAAWSKGRAINMQQAIEYALESFRG